MELAGGHGSRYRRSWTLIPFPVPVRRATSLSHEMISPPRGKPLYRLGDPKRRRPTLLSRETQPTKSVNTDCRSERFESATVKQCRTLFARPWPLVNHFCLVKSKKDHGVHASTLISCREEKVFFSTKVSFRGEKRIIYICANLFIRQSHLPFYFCRWA